MSTRQIDFQTLGDDILKFLRKLKIRGFEDADVGKTLAYLIPVGAALKQSLTYFGEYLKVENLVKTIGETSLSKDAFVELLDEIKKFPNCLNKESLEKLFYASSPNKNTGNILKKILLEKQEIASNCVLWSAVSSIPVIFIEIEALNNSFDVINKAQFLVKENQTKGKLIEISDLVKQLKELRIKLIEAGQIYLAPELSLEDKKEQHNSISLLVNTASIKIRRARSLIDSFKINLGDKVTEINKIYYSNRVRAVGNGASALLNLVQLIRLWSNLTGPWRIVGSITFGAFALITGSNVNACYCSAKTLKYLQTQLSLVVELEDAVMEVEELVENILRHTIGVQNRI